MKFILNFLFTLAAGSLLASSASASGPEQTVDTARIVLEEALSNPTRRIPEKMLQDANAVAIIPNVIKIGFIGGVRRGHGVLLVRDRDGEWGLPQFVTITGGSVGFQIGAQSSDVILVFRSQRSVDNLMRGKFTLGADAAVAAGPVGRRVEAATDLQLRAEILSYARSRGLFAGVSLDGSALEFDSFAHQAFYGSPPNELPKQIPQAATNLVQYLASVTGVHTVARPTDGSTTTTTTTPAPRDLKQIQGELAKSATHLSALLDDNWRKFLALPADVFSGQGIPSPQALNTALANYESVATNQTFAKLNSRSEFQATLELLRELTAGVVASQNTLISLPPPPTTVNSTNTFPSLQGK